MGGMIAVSHGDELQVSLTVDCCGVSGSRYPPPVFVSAFVYYLGECSCWLCASSGCGLWAFVGLLMRWYEVYSYICVLGA